MSESLRVGIIGAGLIAGVHTRSYTATPGVDVVAIADPVAAKADQLAATIGAQVVPDLDALLALDVDIVSVCTPPQTHAALAVHAIEDGRHVLCEKPIARDLDDAARIVAAAHASSKVVMIGHVSRFEPEHRQAKALVDDGYLGDVQMLSHSMTTSMPGWSEGGWLGQPAQSGGPLVDLAVHSFDFVTWVADSAPIRVHAVAADSSVGPSTYVLATVRYASGAMARVETSWAHPVSRGFKLVCELSGTEGRLDWSYDHINGGSMHRAEGETSWFDPLGERGFQAEVCAFVEAIRSGGRSPVPVDDGYQALRLALAADESIRSGEPIDLTTWRLG